MQERWDYLIVLDACRYDYFERSRTKYLSGGSLCCRRSVGSMTWEWRDKSFPDRYEDVVYISSNPYVNSSHSVQGFWGKEHFSEVVDVWASGWDLSQGTVPPHVVTQQVVQALKRFPGKRLIVHYLQPHAPYLGFGADCVGFPHPDVRNENVLQGTMDTARRHRLRSRAYVALCSWLRGRKFFGNGARWRLAHYMGLPPLSPMDAVRRRHGVAGLRRAYEENLHIVLKEVAVCTEYLQGKIAITADHGEFLGEEGEFSHHPGSKAAVLVNVPWLVIDQSRRVRELPIQCQEGVNASKPTQSVSVEDRLRALGYL